VKIMITGKDVNKDIAVLELKMEKGSITNADIVKAITLLIKIEVGIRANLVAIMEKMGVELRKPRISKDRDRKEGKPDEKK